MENAHHLQLPYIIAAQAQKHVTHNEALRMLDALVQLSVKTDSLDEPPAAPEEGARYIVGDAASGDWTGKAGMIAAFQDAAWAYLASVEGWVVWLEDGGHLSVFHDGEWQSIGADGTSDLLGVNATADPQNRLTVSSPATLLTHDGDNHRLVVNKASEVDTASLLFQDDFAGRAEMGLAGDDDFSIKVSPDNVQWQTALEIDAQSGRVGLPASHYPEGLFFNLLEDAGRFTGSPEPKTRSAATFVAPSYLTTYNGSAFSTHGRFFYNTSTFGGTATALDLDVEELIETLTTSTYYRRYGIEFWVMKVACGAGTAFSKTFNSVTRYMSMNNIGSPLWNRLTWGAHLKVLSGSVAVRNTGTEFDLYRNGVKQTDTVVLSDTDGWNQMVYTQTKDPLTHIGFDTTLYKLFAEPNSEYLMALPFLFPETRIPAENEVIGRVPSLTGWR